MKRFVSMILVLLSVSCLFAADPVSKIITAVKHAAVTEKTIQIRLLDDDSIEYSAGAELELPINARGSEYTAFSWILSGNVYTGVKIKFTFYPMLYGGDYSSTYIAIPYTAKIGHSASRVGNTTIKSSSSSSDKANQSSSAFNYNGCTLYYADYYNCGSSVSVSGSEASIEYTANMSTNSVVKSGSMGDTCDHWNRYGVGIIKLDIEDTSDGSVVTTSGSTQIEPGIYYSTVTVEISFN